MSLRGLCELRGKIRSVAEPRFRVFRGSVELVRRRSEV